jgi:hypothetical protein
MLCARQLGTASVPAGIGQITAKEAAMQTVVTRHQPKVQESPRYQVGDVVIYRGYAMKVWTVLNMSVALHPSQSPGLYYVLKGEGMHAHAYFIIPASEVEMTLPLAA